LVGGLPKLSLRYKEGSSRRARAEIVKIESIGPTASPLIPATVINHDPGPLVWIGIDIEVCRGPEESGKVEIDEQG